MCRYLCNLSLYQVSYAYRQSVISILNVAVLCYILQIYYHLENRAVFPRPLTIQYFRIVK